MRYFFLCFCLLLRRLEIHFLKAFEELAGYVNVTLYLQVRKFFVVLSLVRHTFCYIISSPAGSE